MINPRCDLSARAGGRSARFAFLWLMLVLSLLVVILAGCEGVPEPSPVPTIVTTAVTVPTPAPTVNAPTSPVAIAPTGAPGAAPTASAEKRPSLTSPPTARATDSPTEVPAEGPYLVDAIQLFELPAPGHRPSDVVVLGDRIYVANRDSDNVSVVQDGRVVTVVAVGEGPSALTIAPDTGRVYVLNETDVSLTVIEGVHAIETWPLPERANTVALVGKLLWVGSMENGRIYLIDPRDGTQVDVIALDGVRSVYRIAAGAGGLAYATSYDRLHAIDLDTRACVATAKVIGYRAIATTPDGDRVAVAGYAGEGVGSIVWYEGRDLVEVGRAETPPSVSDVVYAPAHGLWVVASGYTNEVLAIDAETGKPVSSFKPCRAPVALALDEADDRLIVASGWDALVNVPVDGDGAMRTIALAPTLADMAFDPRSGRLAIVSSTTNELILCKEGAVADRWRVGIHPIAVGVLPGGEGFAVLGWADETLHLFDGDGYEIATYATGTWPQGLWVDPGGRYVLSGGAMLSSGEGRILSPSNATAQPAYVITIYGGEVPVQGAVLDTRRDHLYVIASNGVPGSNGGLVVSRYDGAAAVHGAPSPGRLSTIDLLYDQKLDLFYSTNSRMGTYGLQVTRAEDMRELYAWGLDAYPAALIHNPATGHVWVALEHRWGEVIGEASNQLVAYDTASWQRVASIPYEGRIDSATVDTTTGEIYLGNSERGLVQVLHDRASKPIERAIPTPRPEPIAPQPTPTACGVKADAQFAPMVEAHASALGCAFEPAQQGDWAMQPFERGAMLWDGAHGVIMLLYGDTTYQVIPDTWREGMPETSCEAAPPKGLSQPVRGFGRAWCEVDGAREALGWAIEGERGGRWASQSFKGGTLLSDGASLWYLARDGRWRVTEAR